MEARLYRILSCTVCGHNWQATQPRAGMLFCCGLPLPSEPLVGGEPRLTREQFEEGYASRSGLTVAEVRAAGLLAAPCDCGEPDCLGWQMVTKRGGDPAEEKSTS